MSTSNYPSATPQSQPPRRDSKNLIIALLAVGILGTWGYFLYDKNKSDKNLAQVQKEYVTVDSSKNELEKINAQQKFITQLQIKKTKHIQEL